MRSLPSKILLKIKTQLLSAKTWLLKRLRKFKAPIKTEQIQEQLVKSGIKPGDTIFVHASLSKLGNINGGANSVIEALQLAIGDQGTLVMPCFSYVQSMLNTVSEKDYVFNPNTTPSVVGLITETFRKLPDVKRSIHPTHSVCAWGKHASEIVGGHFEASSNFGNGTPFHQTLIKSGKIVGLGISIGPVTIYHCLEDLYPRLFDGVYLPHSFELKVVVEGTIRVKKILIHDPLFHKNRIDKSKQIERWFRNHLKSKGILHEDKLAQTNLWWMDINELFNEMLILKEKGITIYSVPAE